jgi:hypothetical protein
MGSTPESHVVSSCLALLELLRIPAWRNNTGAVKTGKRFIRFGKKGSSDILGIIPDGTGRFLAVECKAGKNRPTIEQQAFIAGVNEAGGLGVVVYSADELHDELKQAGVVGE